MQRWRHSEAEIHGNLKNLISQLGPFSSSSSAKTEFYPHPRVVNWKSFARFLFARIWLWKLDSGQILFEKPRQKFCQAELCIPGKQWERRSGDQTQSFIWNIWAETLYLRSTLLCKYILQSQSFSSRSRSTMEKFSGWSIIHPILYMTRNQINDTFLFQNRVKVKVVGEVSEKWN